MEISLPEFPNEIWQYIFSLLTDFDRMTAGQVCYLWNSYQHVLSKPEPYYRPDSLFTMIAARHGYLNILQFAFDNFYQIDHRSWIEASKNGHNHILRWAHDKGYHFNEDVYHYAAQYNRLKTVHLLQEYDPSITLECDTENDCDNKICHAVYRGLTVYGNYSLIKAAESKLCLPLKTEMLELAAYYGHLNIMILFFNHITPYRINRMIREAAKGKQESALKWLLKCYLIINNLSTFSIGIHAIMIRYGYHYLIGNNTDYRYGKYIYCEAARGGNLSILESEVEKGVYMQSNIHVFIAAAKHGHLHILQWLVQNDNKGIFYYSDHKFEEAVPDIFYKAAQFGHIHIIQWALDMRYTFNYHSMLSYVVRGNQLPVLQWMFDNKYIPRKIRSNIREAYQLGRMRIIKLLHEMGYNVRQQNDKHDPYHFASNQGDLGVLIWIHQNDIGSETGRKHVCRNAAKRGHLHILKWAYDNQFPCDSTICEIALNNNHRHIVNWANEIFSHKN